MHRKCGYTPHIHVSKFNKFAKYKPRLWTHSPFISSPFTGDRDESVPTVTEKISRGKERGFQFACRLRSGGQYCSQASVIQGNICVTSSPRMLGNAHNLLQSPSSESRRGTAGLFPCNGHAMPRKMVIVIYATFVRLRIVKCQNM